MYKEYDILPKINRNDLIKTKKYPQLFLPLFITDDMYNKYFEIMPRLNSSQQNLLTYYFFEQYMHIGHNRGFLQLIFEGYSKYVFEKTFSETMNAWGAKKISRIIDRAGILYKKYRDKIEKAKTEKEFSCLCSEITDFEELDHEHMTVCEEEKERIKEYIENNINEFAVIDESNSQISHVDEDIREIDERMKMFEEIEIIIKYIDDNIDKYMINDKKNTFVINVSEIFGENYTKITGCSFTKEVNGKITINVERKK